MGPERLRVALLTYSTRPRGGVVHTLALAEALTARGHDVTVWTLGRGGDQVFFRPVDPRVRVAVVPFAELAGEAMGPRVLRSIRELRAAFDTRVAAGERYDVVHAQDCISANAVPGCVRTVHHVDHFTTPQLAACHERAIATPSAHVCVSRAVADELARGWSLSATVIPNGVAAERFAAAAGRGGRAARQAWRDRLGDYVLAVGGIEPRKGTADLVTAMAEVTRVRPALHLVVAGGETLFDYRPYRAEVDALADRLGVPVTVLGPVPDDTLPALVAAARVFAFPSTKEGFGLAAMEALAAGVPVVVRDLPVLREVFDPAVRFATDPGTLARAILDAAGGNDVNRTEEHARREAGRALAARHTWDGAAAAHERLYRRLLAEGRPVGRAQRTDAVTHSVAMG